jgi:hypothetical protein
LTRSIFLAVVGIAVLLNRLSNGRRADGADSVRRPNVVVIVSDDAGYADFSMQGDKRFPTPHIDSSAARSGNVAFAWEIENHP